mgnify:CR=1 FL=1
MQVRVSKPIQGFRSLMKGKKGSEWRLHKGIVDRP